MPSDKIIIKGAREHNLKNVNLEIPRNQLIVFTGLSGSGKSSLAFDTIYAEGQRRYVESLSAYARQFLEQMQKPDVDSIEGLSPAISIDQKTSSRNPRSTVGTVTEIYDYLRLLFAHVGIPHCPQCGRKIEKQTVEQIVDQIMMVRTGRDLSVQILSPVVRGRKGEYKDLFKDIEKDGFLRVRIDNKTHEFPDIPSVDKKKKHNIEIVVDRIILKESAKKRLAESVETALRYGSGLVLVVFGEGKKAKEELFSEKFSCPYCGISLDEITPRIFSFNSPYGACPECTGLGDKLEFDPDLVIPDKNLSLSEGAIVPWGESASFYMVRLEAVGGKFGFTMDTPIKDLTKKQLNAILYGTDQPLKFKYQMQKGYWEHESEFEGVINNLKRRYYETKSENMRYYLYRFMSSVPCPKCKGQRLKPESLAVKIDGKSIAEISNLSVGKLISFLDGLKLTEREELIAKGILKEIKARLKFLDDVGLNYITLDRQSSTLSGGESQRTRLATQIGSGLVGVLYILDEPSIGLHQKDNQQLIKTLKKLRDLGNTMIVVEHDEETMRAADYLVDIGSGAGIHGGHIVEAGSIEQVIKNKKSITGRYLSGADCIPVPIKRREGNGNFIEIKGAKHHNLKDVDVKFPLSKFIGVTGVSGSGKSSLINDILYNALAKKFYRSIEKEGKHDKILGAEHIDKIIIIDQSPIGRTPRSNPATYTGVFNHIRDLFSMTPEAKARGYQPGRFSFNVKGGRCEACGGDGYNKIEMHFLPDVYVTCDVCKGKRYNRETLEVRYKGKNIFEVLDSTVEEAMRLFENIPQIYRKLQTLHDVGLDYIKLGQSANTLSGGEAQRVKLATELSLRSTGRTLYLLDEPTTGLHFDDIKKLLTVLDRLVDTGNTVIVIEHNLDVIKTVDHIIDLGPDGGDMGGEIVAEGTPEQIAKNTQSYTGHYLKKVLK
ncbi:excinuclease ABC subunit A [candidate division WOR-1 bacterium RIFOXYA12_FULL_43_27]|uniref:UvrABC system protein A n=1 Tax=candidate division WOR-1 bacterium RIFOXYC2_FULL_46_14 TaxID=1802587 RepID=A0A1F4U322_UNCSA|nr:MAG: excinuclease ABC subunit A [candidate division WOR-1 bacterium RIFOXYA12_FULL_43_27]OGC18880.1 MAG: excinuclease ABC subunit A [candidate division WOR-1 bacterium RIFOXYB2_FULL_46_45]OGC29021.1 MAG: excinuclease ABC subunit A [candidate division WOR-1 bacterium RIFOXYA2_FULL_46_56]OGC39279.1 MAG: excinuclease ABC subunit A [candidate division WOR-1 bacterium RIFOXYC2_FULL_46_14]